MSGPSGTALPLLQRGVVVIASATAVSPCRLGKQLADSLHASQSNDDEGPWHKKTCCNTATSSAQAPARPMGVIGNGCRSKSSHDHRMISSMSCQVISNCDCYRVVQIQQYCPYKFHRAQPRGTAQQFCWLLCLCLGLPGQVHGSLSAQLQHYRLLITVLPQCQGIGLQCLQTIKFRLQFSVRPLSPHLLCTTLTAPGCPAAAGAS